jgi:hypothetical protein
MPKRNSEISSNRPASRVDAKIASALIEAIVGGLGAVNRNRWTLRDRDCDLASRVAGFHIAESLRNTA